MMSKIYPLEWLDSLILEKFNPKKTIFDKLSDTDLASISDNVIDESQKIQVQIKNEIFSLRRKRQIRLLVRKYHSTLIFLLDTIIENQKNESFKVPKFSKIIDTIIRSLDELLCFVENRYSYYLNLDEKVPVTYLMVSKKELLLKISKLKKRADFMGFDKKSIGIIIETLLSSIQSETAFKATYRQILYQRELLKNIDLLVIEKTESDLFSCLDELLISLNFNSPQYIHSILERISFKVKVQDFGNDVNDLLFYYKEFNQLYSNEKVMFDPCRQNIRYVLDNWFAYEIAYFESKVKLTSFESNLKVSDKMSVVDDKIECVLSTDQMGLILRATDESRIVKAKSMTQVFKTIIPYLSTPFKKDLSYQSVRSKSYNAEERDKEIAIQTLEKIIRKIRTY